MSIITVVYLSIYFLFTRLFDIATCYNAMILHVHLSYFYICHLHNCELVHSCHLQVNVATRFDKNLCIEPGFRLSSGSLESDLHYKI